MNENSKATKTIAVAFKKVFCFTLLVFISSCSPSNNSPKEKSESIQKRDNFYKQKIEENFRMRLLEAEGGVLNTPLRASNFDQIFETKSGTCFDFEKLPPTWYVQDKRWRGRFSVDNNFFALAAPADSLNAKFYDVILSSKVDYEFVTPGHEFIDIFVHGGTEEGLREKYRTKSENLARVMSGDSFEPSLLQLSEVEGWNFFGFRLVLCLQCSEPKSDGLLSVVDPNNNAYFEVFLSDEHIQKNEFFAKQSPAKFKSGFGKPPTAKGEFLHSSGDFTVSFVVSAHATPQAPELFDKIDKAISALITECNDFK